MEDIVARLGDTVARLAEATLDRFEAAGKRMGDVDERISALVDAQVRTNEKVNRTDEALRSLIAVVDRYFGGGGHGDAEPPG